MSELLAAALGALLGFAVGAIRDARRESRRTRTLASAMLSDLAALDVTVRQTYADPQFAFSDSAFASLTNIDRALDLFEPVTVAALLDIASSVGGARSQLNHAVAEGFSHQTLAVLRITLLGCVQRIARLKGLLEDEGGILPVRLRLSAPEDATMDAFRHATSPPALPPSPFPPL